MIMLQNNTDMFIIFNINLLYACMIIALYNILKWWKKANGQCASQGFKTTTLQTYSITVAL